MATNQTPSAAIFALDYHSPMPISRQLYGRARVAIGSGQLPPGGRLPSARSLAAQLGTARGTVDAAYAMLAGEGWIVARGPAGTIVAPQLSEKPGALPPIRPLMRPGWSSTYATEISPRPFRLRLPATTRAPRKLWARLVASEARALSPAGMAHPDPVGYEKL